MGRPTTVKKYMKRRHRKKHHVGEFQQLCLQFHFTFAEPVTEEQSDKLADDLCDLSDVFNADVTFGYNHRMVDGAWVKRNGKTDELDKDLIRSWALDSGIKGELRLAKPFDAWHNDQAYLYDLSDLPAETV